MDRNLLKEIEELLQNNDLKILLGAFAGCLFDKLQKEDKKELYKIVAIILHARDSL